MIGVILAGGAGTRLWPVSRAYWPKFLLTFPSKEKKNKITHPVSPSEHAPTLIQQTFLRLASMTPPQRIFAVVNEEHKFFVKENITGIVSSYPALENIISEPVSRNTLPAIFSAAAKTWVEYGDEPMVICPSDHIITDLAKFRRAVKTALAASSVNGRIVVFGIKPDRPETGYGYICPGDRIFLNDKNSFKNIISAVYSVRAFAEKPSLEKARSFIKSGRWLWNAGIFVMKPSVLFGEIKKYQPDFYRIIEPIIAKKQKSSCDLPSVLRRIYPELPSVSIDYGIIEKSSRVAVVKLDSRWDDVGDWGAIERIYPRDSRGNVFIGDVASFETSGSFVIARSISEGGRLVGTVGLKDVIIVDTADALLVAGKDSAQKVRELVKSLPQRSDFYKETTLRHKIVPRPWGEYDVIASGDGYKVKIIKVLPHKKLSLQKHLLRSERWTALKGTALVVKDGKRITLREGETVEIPRRAVHRLENNTKKEIHILEISRGKYIGEDDILRVEDDFGRN